MKSKIYYQKQITNISTSQNWEYIVIDTHFLLPTYRLKKSYKLFNKLENRKAHLIQRKFKYLFENNFPSPQPRKLGCNKLHALKKKKHFQKYPKKCVRKF